MRWSIIIPAHDAEDTIDRLLVALADCGPADAEVIVVDDGSQDDTGSIAHRRGASVIRNESSEGPAGARNTGARLARGEWLLFMDADVVPVADTFSRLEAHLAERPDIQCFTGVYDLEPTDPGLFQRYRAVLNYSYIRTQPPLSVTSLFVTAIAGIKRPFFSDLGGFDAGRIGAHAEDTEFGYRVAGRTPVWLMTDVRVRHRFPTFANNLKNYYHRAGAWVRLFSARRRFDDQTTTAGRGASKLIGGMAAAASAGGLVCPPLWIPAGLLHGAYACTQAPLLALLLKHLKPWEVPAAYLIDVALAGAAAAGAVHGASQLLTRSESVPKE